MPAQSPVLFFEYKLAYSVGAVTLPCQQSHCTFHFFSSKQPNAPSMAMRKIGVGTLVFVEQESTGHGRRRPSEGGIGFVIKRKKQRCLEDKNGETPVVELTQQSTTSTTTAGTGATMFDIRYSLDGRLSQEVNKNRVRVGMLGTTARQRNGSREVRPSLLTASTTTTNNNNNNNNNNTSHNNRRSVGLKKYTHQWLLVAMDHKTRDGEQKHIAALQHKKRTESQGWLRWMEAHQVETQQHLSEVEKKKAMDLLLACKPHDSAIPLVAFAWGVNATTMRCIWFWSIVVRRNLKCIPVLGIEPGQHGVQHKSHLDKTMGIASTGFIPTNNDITKGGVAHLVSLTRVGKSEKAVRNTYKRVYKPDGTYHYPKVQSNVLRKKGQFYFKNLEITGSSTGTTKNPKFCLLDWFKNIKIPACEELCRKVGTTEKTILRYQMDGAGPHQDGKLLEFINDEFQKRGWLLKFQPSNSPVTNVKDDSLFPALSKHISREQGINKGSQTFTPDELWAAVKKCWHNFPLDSLARGYVRHAQMASALVACNGGDDFV